MRALIFIDLDNVLDCDGVAGLSQTAGEQLRQHRAMIDDCVVAVACNTTTVLDEDLSFAGVRAMAAKIAEALGPQHHAVEVALALTMPQTADVLLQRLARSAPSAAGAGPYGVAAVLSFDRGLRLSLGEIYQQQSWKQRASWAAGSLWCMPAGGRAVMRKRPRRPLVPRASGAAISSTDFSVCIDDDAAAAWAAERPIDVQPQVGLMDLAGQVDSRPWLLSQVGATQSSLCGIKRLAQLPGDKRQPICPFSPRDKIEMRGEGPFPATVEAPIKASVGIGAVRCQVHGATVRSRLPVAVLAAGNAAYPIDGQGIRIGQALHQLPQGPALGQQSVNVRLRRKSNTLVAKVEHAAASQPQAWWLLGGSTTKSERRLAGASRLLPASLTATAVPVRLGGQIAAETGHKLALRSPLEAGDSVVPDSAIAPGSIGAAWSKPTQGEPTAVAVFSPNRALDAGKAVKVTPIHQLTRSGMLVKFPAELWALPLVVPQ